MDESIVSMRRSGGRLVDFVLNALRECHASSDRQTLLQSQFSTLIDGCGGLPDESSLEVEFQGGCATRLSASISGPPDHADLLGCVGKALDALHFACADDLDCASVKRSTLSR